MNEQRPITTVDVVLFGIAADGLSVLLTKRTAEPFVGSWALPGGFVHVDEDVSLQDTAKHVLREKTSARTTYLEQLATFAGRSRDPRGWAISVSYYALVPINALGDVDGKGATLCSVLDLPSLAFDHKKIIKEAVSRLRNKSAYSTLPTFLVPKSFTLAELQKVYEAVIGEKLDRTTFRRTLLSQGVIEPVVGATRGGAQRPAQLFQRTDRSLTVLDREL